MLNRPAIRRQAICCLVVRCFQNGRFRRLIIPSRSADIRALRYLNTGKTLIICHTGIVFAAVKDYSLPITLSLVYEHIKTAPTEPHARPTMTQISYDDLQVGDELPEHKRGPITRATLALYAGASGDHNPMHIDSDFAKQGGMDDVFTHGMLSMAYLGQLLTNWVDQRQLRDFGVRFTSITPVHATLTCKGKVIEKSEIKGEPCVKLELTAEIDDGTKTLMGDAVIGFG